MLLLGHHLAEGGREQRVRGVEELRGEESRETRQHQRRGCLGLWLCVYVHVLGIMCTDEVESQQVKMRQYKRINKRCTWMKWRTAASKSPLPKSSSA